MSELKANYNDSDLSISLLLVDNFPSIFYLMIKSLPGPIIAFLGQDKLENFRASG